MKYLLKYLFLLTGLGLAACSKEGGSSFPRLFNESGDIKTAIDEFRKLAGATINTTTGVTEGRREVNWDAVSDNLLGKAIAFDFFNPVGAAANVSLQRGLVYDEVGKLVVSNTGFAELKTGNDQPFAAFSGKNNFANTAAAAWPVGFRVAGTNQLAATRSFGMVFSDIDLDNSTTLEFFNDNKSLGVFPVKAQSGNSPFSFFGIVFPEAEITKVMIRHKGTLSEGVQDISVGGSADLVAFDDIIYSEPLPHLF